MIDLERESPVTLTQACRLPVFDGTKRPHPATLSRWTQKGLGGVQLDSIDIGGRRCTSEAALRRFFASLTKARNPIAPRIYVEPASKPNVCLPRSAGVQLQREGW